MASGCTLLFCRRHAEYQFLDLVDPVEDATLRTIAGSHRWDKMVLPVRWLNEDAFYANEDDYLPVPDPDAHPDDYDIREWPMQPGDAVAFHFRAVHGARAICRHGGDGPVIALCR